ncbi:MAG: hypothetical protein MRY64_00850 [Hyphomonadaceae bacterium]|nr:hypothetical protein [Hyphomonadaceae bacterium]
MIDGRRRLTVSGELLQALSWKAEIGAGLPVRFDLAGAGFVQMMPGDFVAELDPLSPTDRADMDFIRPVGKWETGSRLTVPRMVCAHLFGPGVISGGVFVIVEDDELQLWNEAYRLDQLATRRARLGLG